MKMEEFYSQTILLVSTIIIWFEQMNTFLNLYTCFSSGKGGDRKNITKKSFRKIPWEISTEKRRKRKPEIQKYCKLLQALKRKKLIDWS